MISLFEGSSKLEDIKYDSLSQIQDYFNDNFFEKATMKFRIRTKMLEKIPGTFKNKYKNQENGLQCNMCPGEMTQNHRKICPGRETLREGLNMDNLDDLVQYFTEILSERTARK